MSRQDSPEEQFLEFKKHANSHSLLASLSFLVILPAGVLIARYLRTFTNRWFHVHWIINGLIGFPLIVAAGVMGSRAHDLSYLSLTPHGKRGLSIIGLYVGQLVLGMFIHHIRIPFPFFGYRPPQNFIHALLGLTILALANYQVHDGIYHKARFYLAPDVLQSAKHAWLALLIIFWSLYVIGLAFLRRQYKNEQEGRQEKDQETYTLGTGTGSTP